MECIFFSVLLQLANFFSLSVHLTKVGCESYECYYSDLL